MYRSIIFLIELNLNMPWAMNWTVFEARLYRQATVIEPIFESWSVRKEPLHWLWTPFFQWRTLQVFLILTLMEKQNFNELRIVTWIKTRKIKTYFISTRRDRILFGFVFEWLSIEKDSQVFLFRMNSERGEFQSIDHEKLIFPWILSWFTH